MVSNQEVGSRTRKPRAGWLLGGAMLLLSACSQCNPGAKTDGKPVRPAEDKFTVDKSVSLEINGFNYTDLYIDGFIVNGQGGGNIFVSSPKSGGGGSVCCVSLWPGLELPTTLKVEWTRDNNRWCIADVVLKGPVPPNPQHLGIHFFPDGHIEAELSEDYPALRLVLDRFNDGQRKQSGNQVSDERGGKCQDGPY